MSSEFLTNVVSKLNSGSVSSNDASLGADKKASTGRFLVPLTPLATMHINENGGVREAHSARNLNCDLSYAAGLRFFGFVFAFVFLSRFATNSSATAFCSFSVSTR